MNRPNRHPSRRTLRGALCLLLGLMLVSPLALALHAQPPVGGPGGPGGGLGEGPHTGGGPGQHGRAFPLARIARILELSDAQVEQARALLEDHVATVQPLHEQSRQLREELEGLLAGDAPDPAAVGSRVIEVHGLHEQVRGARSDFEAAFEALLTPEQQERWDLLRDVRAFLGGGRGGRR